MKKKLISFLCILSLLMTNVMPAYATESQSSNVVQEEISKGETENEIINESILYVNPVYADQITEEELSKEISKIQESKAESSSKARTSDYISDLDVLAGIIREKLVNREETIVVNYKGSSSEGILERLFDMALEDTDVPTEGDYLKFQYGGYKGNASGTVSSGIYCLTLTYIVPYYTNIEQEQQVDAAVESLLTELKIKENGQISTAMSDYEKVCEIYDYICENVRYDYEHLEDKSYVLKATAYAALINKTAVCQGYANLFYRLAEEAGVDARIISGNAIEVATNKPGPHAWNIVEIDGKYYNLDSTWDEGQDSYGYFLKGSSDFDEADDRYVHVSDDEYLTEEFMTTHPIANSVYEKKDTKYATINIETEEGSKIVDLDGNSLPETFTCEVGTTLEFHISVDDNYELMYYCYGFEGENTENNFGGSDIPWNSENENYYINIEHVGTYTLSTFTSEKEIWEQNLLRSVGNATGTRYFGNNEAPKEDVIYQIMKMYLDEYLNDDWYYELSYAQYMKEVDRYFVNYSEMKDYLIQLDVYNEAEDKILIYSGGAGGGADWILTSTYEKEDGSYVLQGIYISEYYPQGVKYDELMNIVHPVELTISSKTDGEWKIISYEMGSYYISEAVPGQGKNLYTYDEEGNYDGGIYHPITLEDAEHSKINITSGIYSFKNNDGFWYNDANGFEWTAVSEEGYICDVNAEYYNWDSQEREVESIGTSGSAKWDCAVTLMADEAALFGIETDHAKVEIIQGMQEMKDGTYAYKAGSSVELKVTAEKGYLISKVVVGDSEATYISASGTYNAYPFYKPGKIVVETKEDCSVSGHDYSSEWVVNKKATKSMNGNKSKHCTVCGSKSVKTIYKASNVTLSATSYTYNGKIKSPSVKVKDSEGNTIASSNYDIKKPSGRINAGKYTYKVVFKNEYEGTKELTLTINPKKITSLSLSTTSYTYDGKVKTPSVTVKADTTTVASKRTTDSSNVDMTYASGRKNVGSYKVTVKGRGNYTGTLTKIFKINPKKTSINSISKGKKSFTVKWNKVSSQATGYQIKYSRNSSMSGAKTVTVTSYKTTSKTIKSLIAKKKYYVQIRTYKKTSSGTYYSAWSSKRSVTTK